MMATPISLENFDYGSITDEPESQDYKLGFENGLNQADAIATDKLTTAASELTTTLNEIAFGYEEALQQILAKLTPLMSQISEIVVPAILAETFQLHLAETLIASVKSECEGGFQILVSPERAELLDSEKFNLGTRYDVVASDDLIKGQAIISSGSASQMLDLASLTNALHIALQGIDQSEWRQLNG